LVEYKLVKPYEKKHRGSSEIKNRSSNLTPGIYPKEMKSVCWRDICAPISSAALFTIAKIWNLPRCQLTDE
jgi:hypothetical protein